MRTTIDINDSILDQLKRTAESRGRPLKEVLNESLRLGLAVLEKPLVADGFEVKSHPLGLKRAYQGESLNRLFDDLEAEQDAGRL